MRFGLWAVMAGVTWLGLSVGCDRPDPALEQERRQQQIDGMYVAGTSFYLSGEFAKALELFQKVRELAPDDHRLPAAIGEVYLAQSRLDEALEQFRIAAKLEPNRGTNWSRIGFILAQKGQRDEAKEALRRALALGATDFNAMEILGEIAQEEGHVDEAVKWLLEAAEHAPAPTQPAFYLRVSELLRKANRVAEALPMLKKGVARAPAGPLFVELGDLQVRTGDFAGALESYREAARRMPRDPTLWELVANIQLRMDEPGDAEASFRESLRVEDRAVVHVALARMQLARKNRPGAEAELELALKTATGEEERESIELADLLVTMDRKPDALKLLSVLASEEELHQNVTLQKKVAGLAKQLGRSELVTAACARVRTAKPTEKCP